MLTPAQNATISPTASAVGSPYLTAVEAAAYLRIGLKTFYNVRKFIPRMPGVRKLLFTRAALDKFAATPRRASR
jgi:hypothetical protein